MGTVQGIVYYVGPKVVPATRPCGALRINDGGALCQTFRKALLAGKLEFRVHLRVLQFPPLTCHWEKAGDTACVVRWMYGRVVEAATVYVNGLDAEDEHDLVHMTLTARRLPIPLYVWQDLIMLRQRPVYATFLFTPASLGNRVIATAAPALANSFFSILGTV